jgi:hypothetical protein
MRLKWRLARQYDMVTQRRTTRHTSEPPLSATFFSRAIFRVSHAFLIASIFWEPGGQLRDLKPPE